ncbi:hypothetical protein F8S09_07010 [Deinococcus sp. SDU3-2]|uniref:DUF4402 domain-containing protein n=1 Tax=Deinococcus terrestris TaxID=2651870 RepID=A0A7X1TR68_9DEIO|nr:hypothetical protein [Deinococcus terrestris]MPY66445.1 hypothetical protein [Deinococcus terrestris]
MTTAPAPLVRALQLGTTLLVLGLGGPGQAQTAPAPPPPPALLWDGQRLTLDLSFQPGDPSGPAYPPRGGFSRTQPAYYPPLGTPGPVRLNVTTYLPRAALLLRVRGLPDARGATLPVGRLEYRVGTGPWLRAGPLQVVALVPDTGRAIYDLSFRLRLEGDEPAGQYRVLLTWALEAQ